MQRRPANRPECLTTRRAQTTGTGHQRFFAFSRFVGGAFTRRFFLAVANRLGLTRFSFSTRFRRAVDPTIVRCSNTQKGAQTRVACSKGCIGCMKCEKVCPTGAIKVVDNLARIDYDKCVGCVACSENCPVGVIQRF